ncbi:hypothetical protein LWC34_53760 [Kibdelosporangium philippinense]|uniref:Uncharacterized protein n=1 Tax=Kibdelosporangium philippinense TaxID=211113 RepID=A0ABS8ZV99_9PSEU|nr:hypothetical protein [Kibdelosporangium philippinense]MCE7011626.1 hypothetical protein [Kibdelosporangium philippinense]
MTGNDPAHVERLAALLRPVDLLDFVLCIRRWLQEAHTEAAELQPLRKNYRGEWGNNVSFGTDRHQYLLQQAHTLHSDIPELEADAAFQSVLLKVGRAGVYQFNAPKGPHGSLGEVSDLRRELLTSTDDMSLFGRPYAWLSGREPLLLPWSGTETDGLTGSWAGQGTLQDDNHISWAWLVDLEQLAEGSGGKSTPLALVSPLGPTLFDESPPAIPMRPRTEQRRGSAG